MNDDCKRDGCLVAGWVANLLLAMAVYPSSRLSGLGCEVGGGVTREVVDAHFWSTNNLTIDRRTREPLVTCSCRVHISVDILSTREDARSSPGLDACCDIVLHGGTSY